MSTIIESLKTRQKTTTETAQTEWRNLVIAVADGTLQTDPDDVLATLDRLGKSLDDLHDIADKIAARRELVERITTAKTASTSIPGIRSQIQTANDALKRAEELHERTVAPLQAELTRIAELEAAATAAKTELRNGAGEAYHAAARQIGNKIATKENDLKALRQRVRDLATAIDANERHADRGTLSAAGVAGLPRSRENLAALEAAVKTAEAELQALVTEQAALAETLALDPTCI